MQFVKNSPDVAERLLQAHEDGHVVFFCGAGISYPAGLPGFSELTKGIYADLNVTPNPVQQAAMKAKEFDRAIGLLEDDVVGGRDKVRRSLAKILMPDLSRANATATHEALLTLGRNREGRTRLVTTNFDRLFEEVIVEKSLGLPCYSAPQLPVPKNRWDGLVYLHGLLPGDAPPGDLDDLVVASGDFGRAYLTERWAARFASELFRNYTVCFVGYSIDDPVLRYMTDALAADRLRGESPLEMFAFGSYSKGKKAERANEWKAKNVTPILYRTHRRHWYLHETLRRWAETYRDGVSGKESIVERHARSTPRASTQQDDYVGRVLWALSDSSGLPAKRFADLDPVPPLEWLEPFSEEIYGDADLSRFGLPPGTEKDDSLNFSLICKPTDYSLAPRMTLMDEAAPGTVWDKTMHHLARWLIRHLDDPTLLLRLTQRGRRIHREFADLVALRLKELDELERDGKTDELNRIRESAPRAVPRPMMLTLWRLLLAGRVKARWPTSNTFHWFTVFQWRRRLERDGLTIALRLELRDMLTPLISLNTPFPPYPEQEDSGGPERLTDLVEWEIVLSIDDVYSALRELQQIPRWPEALPSLLEDFCALLRDAMDLARELGGADDRSDRSFIHQPSIAVHSQNVHLPERAALIELTRDAWLATKEIAAGRARRTAENWWNAPYPVFRRLALFAATQEDVIPTRQGLDWLLADDNWWFWSVETHREAMRLLVELAPRLDAESLARLERSVLDRPPDSMYNDGIEPERLERMVEREVWLRLAKMDDVGVDLGAAARAHLAESRSRHPEWRLEPDERDEFPVWMGGSGEGRSLVHAPRRRRELVDWLKQNPETDVWQDDNWSQRCRNNFSAAACALCALARENIWPTVRWHQALNVWSDDSLLKRSWRHMAPVLAEAPRDELRPLAHEIGRWLENVGKALDPDEVLFFRLCRAIFELDFQDDSDEDDDDLVTRAINHPVGHVTEALLNWWTRGSLQDGQRLPDRLSPVFTEICDVHVGSRRPGRVVLASRVITLFRVDHEWATQNLLPLFDWRRHEIEARAAWSGFLWAPRLYRPLMEVIKIPFLDTARRYDALGEYGSSYASLLTSAALDSNDTFTKQELAAATKALPPSGLRLAAETLVDALDAAGGQRAEFWRNRVWPYLHTIWSPQHDRKTSEVSECFCRLCIAAGEAFPEVLEELRDWLQPLQYPGHSMGRLKDSGLCSKFPAESLDLLRRVTGDKPPLGDELRECLQQIQSAEPTLKNDPRFRRLLELLHSQGQELE